MPIPPFLSSIAGPIIGAAGNVFGTLFGRRETQRQNEASRKWSEQMYRRQYMDNLEFWRMQNAYNSPQEQMKRLQEAGLNPALMYGKSASAGLAAPVKSPEVQKPEFRVPAMEGFGRAGESIMSGYMDWELKKLQADNLKRMNTVHVQEANLKAAQTLGILTQRGKTEADIDMSRFDLGMKTRLRDITIEAAEEGLRQIKARTDVILSTEERNVALHAPNMQIAAEKVLQLRLQNARDPLERQKLSEGIRNLKSDTRLKDLDYDLFTRKGMSRRDPLWLRMLIMNLERILEEKPWTGMFFNNPFKN